MPIFTILVSDRRGKYLPRKYVVDAPEEFLAYGPATERFITDSGHRPIKFAERRSTYYARFWNEAQPRTSSEALEGEVIDLRVPSMEEITARIEAADCK